MNKVVVIGHRGVGKTSFLKRLKTYWGNKFQAYLDLDAEIIKKYNLSIEDIFNNHGEKTFREYEMNTFTEINGKYKNFVMSVGGGFPVQNIPEDIHCLWLQRASDKLGRIFLDRPRLNPNQTEISEYLHRAQERNPAFQQRADEKYLLPEGLKEESEIEKQLLAEKIDFDQNCFFTIPKNLIYKLNYLHKIASAGWELRDDWLNADEIEALVNQHSPKQWLISFRSAQNTEATIQFISKQKKSKTNVLTDWALELGEPTQLINQLNIVSLHEFLPNENLSGFLKRLEAYSAKAQHLKASPLVRSFDELEVLWQWQRQAPQQRSVLPRSEEGRWFWFRLLMKGQQKINFFKDSEGSAPDQPSLYQWLATPNKTKHFTAVLGTPVLYSRTPLAQQKFFQKYSMPVWAIDIHESEFAKAFSLIDQMGLRAAAVTSPLKKAALQLLEPNKLSNEALKLKAVNTLSKSLSDAKQPWSGTNTDLIGFKNLVADLDTKEHEIIVWGGGGTLEVIREVYPNAIEYSVRTGLPRDKAQTISGQKQILVWAAGPTAAFPPEHLKPNHIVDLNYREDSQARAYAKKLAAAYTSGEKMFYAQTEEQMRWYKL